MKIKLEGYTYIMYSLDPENETDYRIEKEVTSTEQWRWEKGSIFKGPGYNIVVHNNTWEPVTQWISKGRNHKIDPNGFNCSREVKVSYDHTDYYLHVDTLEGFMAFLLKFNGSISVHTYKEEMYIQMDDDE